jgi:hypothetical protein
MSTQESLTLIAIMLAPAFFSLIGMAALGSPAVAVASEILAKTKGRVFYDKYGQQTAAMGLILLLLFLVIQVGTAALVFTKFPQLAEHFRTSASPFTIAYAALGVFIVLSLPYFLTWKRMREAKGAHMTMGVVAALAAAMGIAVAVPAKLLIGLPAETVQAPLAPLSMLWPMAAMYVVLCFAAASALSAVYLVVRRTRDDFGRDYYRFSLNLASRWAVGSTLAFLACQGWLFAALPDTFRTMTTETPLGMIWGAGCILGLVCTALWLVTARSETPLRFKGLTMLAAVLLWLMHAMNATLFLNFMSML